MVKKLHRKTIIIYICLIPLLWILGWVVFYPTFNSLIMSIGLDQGNFTWDYFVEFFTYSQNITAYMNTFKLAIMTVIVCGIIGTFFAFMTTRYRFFGRDLIDILLLIPMMVPGVLFTIALMQIYGESGFIPQIIKQLFSLETAPSVLHGFTGIMFVHATTQYMFFYVMVSGALKRIDSSVYDAARSLGASKIRMFFTITLPLLTPALVGAGVMTFMSGVGSFAAPNLIGGNFRTMSVQMLMTKTNGFYNLVSVQGIMLALMSIVFLIVMRYYETRRNFIVDVKGRPLEPIKVEGFWKNFGFFSIMFLFILIIILPILCIVLLSFVPRGAMAVDIFPKTFSLDNYFEFFQRKQTLQPFLNSLKMALIGTIGAVTVGTISSYIIIKTKVKIRFLVELLVFLPWALPASTVGVNMILAFNQPTVFAMNQVLVGSSILLPMTYAVTRVTVIVRNTNAALLQLHDSIEEASRSLGASWIQTFFKIVVPIIAPSILAGAMLSFVALIGEYTISVLMYTVSTMPVSVAMINSMNNFNVGVAMVYGVFLVGITIIIVTASKKFKKVGDLTF